jgi:hypothetical protein
MPNGATALHLAFEPAPDAPTGATAGKPDAAPAATEIAIGEATAAAACVVARAMSDYRLHGVLDPTIKLAGGEQIAKVATLQLDHGLGDRAFAVMAREHGKLQLQQYVDAGFCQHCSPADIETAIDLAIDSVLEIVTRVVKDERTFRAAWAN